MTFLDRDINIFTGPGRNFFEYSLAFRFRPEVSLTKRRGGYLKRVGSDTAPENILEFALTEDLFISEKYLIFPELNSVRTEIKDVVIDLAMKKADLRATVFVPVKNPEKLKKVLRQKLDIIDVGENAVKSAARSYIEAVCQENDMDISPIVLDILTISPGDEPITLISEVEKILMVFGKEKKVTVEKFEKYSDPRPELAIFKIMNELTGGNVPGGVGMLYRYIHVIDESEIVRALGAFQWAVKREISRTKRKDRKTDMLALLFLALDIDLRIKGESRLSTKDVFLSSLPYVASILRKEGNLQK